MKRSRGVVSVLAAAVLVLASCGDDDESSETQESVPSTLANPFVDPEDVLVAGILLTIGDIDRAVASGLVNPEEVDTAIAALEAGTMADWLVGGGD